MRWEYYGELLPNIAHAKVGGFAIECVVTYLWSYCRLHWVFTLGIVASIANMLLAFRARSVSFRVATPLIGVVAAQIVHFVSIGGDFKPTGRFLQLLFPLFAVLTTQVLRGLPRWVLLGVGALCPVQSCLISYLIGLKIGG